ncbi:DUF4968 domain-containing protein, partial [Akkermansiaceae bacterium]|nr:DUF4968 domain-containing protein [Akkermansiaceae bacterium]
MQTANEETFEKDNYIETGMPAEAGEVFPGKVVEHRDEGFRQVFVCDNFCALMVTCVEVGVIRFRFSATGAFAEDFSYAVLPKALEKAFPPEVSQIKNHYAFKTGELVVLISRDGLKIRIEDDEGNLLSEDEKGFHWRQNEAYGGEVVMMSRVIQSRE